MKWRVYMQRSFVDSSGETNVLPREFISETTATSPAKAINNVRYRVFGARNPTLVAMPCDGAMRVDWFAELTDAPPRSIAELTKLLHRAKSEGEEPEQLSLF